ncbi:MAG: RDD family protein [Bacteroidota bacterium]
MSLIQIATPFNIDIEFEIAGFHKRLFAYLIDLGVLIVYLYAMKYILFSGFGMGEESLGFIFLIVLLPMIFYTFLAELWMNGQTIGKKILRIKVISLDGGEPTFSQFLLRWFMRFYEWGFIVFVLFWGNPYFGYLVLIIGSLISVIFISASKKSQRIGDMVAGTVVVNTASDITVHDTIFMNINETGYQVKYPQAIKLSDRDINTIKNVITQAQKTNNYQMCNRVAGKVKNVLEISSDMYDIDFLEKIMEDYNYLATRE